MQRCAGKKREPPPHNLESAERRREGALLETRPRASQGIWDPAAPPRRGVVPECRRRRVARGPPPARRRARGLVTKNTPAVATLRRRRTRGVVIGSSLNFWGESTSPEKARRPVELRGRPRCTAYLLSMSRRAERRRDAIARPSRTPGRTTSSKNPRRSNVVLLLPIRTGFGVRLGRTIHARNGMLAFLRRPRTKRLREYERQLAVQVTVFAIATISETERHDLNRRRPREPIDRFEK